MNSANTVIILYNQDHPQCADITQRLTDFTAFKLSASHLPVVKTNNIDNSLNELSSNYQWAVVVMSGSKFNNPQIFDQIVDHCIGENSPLAAHLLLKNNYINFHPQFFCVNLLVYKQFNNSLLADPLITHVVSPEIEWSTDCVHDDYTPWWCQSKDSNIQTIETGPVEFGQKFIAFLMCNNYRVVNIPREIRAQKFYCYAETSHNDIRKFMADPTYSPLESGVRQFVESIKHEFNNLQNGFYPLNSEQLANTQIKQSPIKIFAGVCGGIKPAVLVSQPIFDPNCKVMLFDISITAIKWQQHLRQYWNGDFDSFDLVYQKFINQHPAAIPCLSTNRTIDEHINWFLKDKCTREEFYSKWKHWLTLDVEYIHCDMLKTESQELLLKKINAIHGASYIWTSNLFYMDWQMFMYGAQWSIATKNSWIELIKRSKISTVILENEQTITVY